MTIIYHKAYTHNEVNIRHIQYIQIEKKKLVMFSSPFQIVLKE